MYIYKITNKINNKYYVGKCCKDINVSKEYYGSGILIRKAIEKYGKNNFVKEILEIVNDIMQLNIAEKRWIKYFEYPNNQLLYNLCDGGLGTSGKIVSDVTKQKISVSVSKSLIGNTRALGSKRSEKAKHALSLKMTGRKVIFSKSHCDSLSKALKGRKNKACSDITKERIGKSNVGKKRTDFHKLNIVIGKLKDENVIREYMNDVKYIYTNISLSTKEISKHVKISKSVINRIKSNTHWSKYLDLTLPEPKLYLSSFNLTEVNFPSLK